MGGGLDDPDPPGGDPPSTGFYRVFHIPDWLFDVATYTYDGPWFFPIDFADYLDRVQDIQMFLDGQPTGLAGLISMDYGGQTYWGMGICFDRIPSGTHQIQLVSTIHLNDHGDDDATFLVLSNLTRSIVVDNQVTFTNWDDTIWNNTNYTFRAQTKTNSTDWSIDIYDYWGDYVNGAAGHTTNGQIEWTWDLKDVWDNTRDSLESDPYFNPEISFTDATGSPTARDAPVMLMSYPDKGGWEIAYQDTFYDEGTATYAYMVETMQGIRGEVMSYDDLWSDFTPIPFGTNGYTQQDRDNGWLEVKNLLKQPACRNFYYFGHGNSNSIGGDLSRYDTNGAVTGCDDLPHSQAHLYPSTVMSEVTSNLSTGVRQYRFVWLDGCNTALGRWPDAFGINKATNDIGYYTNSVTNPSHSRPSAFVGWATTPGGPGWGSAQNDFYCRNQWIFDWTYNSQTHSLVTSLEYGCTSIQLDTLGAVSGCHTRLWLPSPENEPV
jgi:hypothetical protein